MHTTHGLLKTSLVLACMAALAGAPMAMAESDEPGAAHPFKLTLGYYDYGQDQGKDINLRWSEGDTHAWIGHYEDHSFGAQDRMGVDTNWAANEWLSFQPSLQTANGGFWGGSLNAQAGHDTFVVLGWGRTNLKPYFNLNFDPNDAITLGVGHVFENGQSWGLSVIRDDRLHTGQMDRHLTGRIPFGQDRLSVDLMYKTGQGDAGWVKAWSYSLTWDFPRWFLRVARDPKQGFSSQDANRLSTGFRF